MFGLTFQLSFVYLLNYLTHAMQSRLLNFILAIISVRWIVVNINRSFFFYNKTTVSDYIDHFCWCLVWRYLFHQTLTVIFEENIQWIHTQSQTNAVVT